MKLSSYFKPEATKEILDCLMPHFNFQDSIVYKMSSYLSVFLPCQNDDYLMWKDTFLKLWNEIGLFTVWDMSFFRLYSRLAKMNYSRVNWSKDDFTFFFSRIQRSFEIPISATQNVTQFSDNYDYNEVIFYLFPKTEYLENDHVLLRHQCSLLVWILRPDYNEDMFFGHLGKLLKTFEHFYNPEICDQHENSDFMEILISFLCEIVGCFIKRIRREQKAVKKGGCKIDEKYTINKKIKDRFTNLLLPLVLNCIQIEERDWSKRSNSCAHSLCVISPEYCFPIIIGQCEKMVKSFLTPVQKVNALKTLGAVTFPMSRSYSGFNTKLLRSFMYDIILNSLDVNDQVLTKYGLRFLNSIFICCPVIAVLGEKVFGDWSEKFLKKIFTVLYHVNPSSQGGESLLEREHELFDYVFENFFSQLSEDIYDNVLKFCFKFVSTELLFNTKYFVGFLISSACYINQEKCLKMLFPFFKKKILDDVENNSLCNMTEREIEYYFYLLGSLMHRAGPSLLLYKKDIMRIVEVGFMKINTFKKKGEIASFCLFFQNIFCSNLLLFQRNHIPVTKSKFEEILKINHPVKITDDLFPPLKDCGYSIHLPTIQEVQFSYDLATSLLRKIKEAIENEKDSVEETSPRKDTKNLYNVIRALKSVVKGISVLFLDIQSVNNIYPHLIGEGIEKYLIDPRKVVDLIESAYKKQFGATGKVNSPSLLKLLVKLIDHLVNETLGRTNIRPKKTSREMFKLLVGYDKEPRFSYINRVHANFYNRPIIMFLFEKSFFDCKWRMRIVDILFHCSLSNYLKIRKVAQDTLVRFASCLRYDEMVIEFLVEKIIEVLNNPKDLEDESKMKGCIYLLKTDIILSHVVMKFKLFSKIVSSYCDRIRFIKDIKIQALAYEVFDDIFILYYQSKIEKEEEILYKELVVRLCKLANLRGVHWKYRTMILSFLTLLVRPEEKNSKFIPNSNLLFPGESFGEVIPFICHSNFDIRMLSNSILNQIMAQLKFHNDNKVKVSVESKEDFEKWENFYQNPPDNIFIDKCYFGWNFTPKVFCVETHANPTESESEEKNNNRNNMIVAIEMLLDSKDLMKAYIKFMSTERNDNNFQIGIASFWRGVFQLVGAARGLELSYDYFDKLADKFVGSLEKKTHEIDDSSKVLLMNVVGEYWSGFIRALKNCKMTLEEEDSYWTNYLLPMLDKILEINTNEGIEELDIIVGHAMVDRDIRREAKLFDHIWNKVKYENFFKNSPTNQGKYVSLLHRTMADINWKDYSNMNERVVVLICRILKSNQDVSKITRDKMAVLLAHCFRNIFTGSNLAFRYPNGKGEVTNLRMVNHLRKSAKFCTEQVKETLSTLVKKITKGISEGNDVEHVTGLSHFVVGYIGDQFYHSFHAFSEDLVFFMKVLLCIQSIVVEAKSNHVQDEVLQATISDSFLLLSSADFRTRETRLKTFQFVANTLASSSFIFNGKRVSFESNKSKSVLYLVHFFQMFCHIHDFYLPENDRKTVFIVLEKLLNNDKEDVRDVVCSFLANFLRISSFDLINKYVEKVMKDLTAIEKITKEKTNIVFCACAVVEAFPFSLPSFMPLLLVELGKFVTSQGQGVREKVKKVFNVFWNTHKDKWREYKKSFSSNQLEVVTSLLISPTYYA